MNAYSRLLALTAAAGALLMPSDAIRAQLLITGNDEKVSFDENIGKTIHAPSRQGHSGVRRCSVGDSASFSTHLPNPMPRPYGHQSAEPVAEHKGWPDPQRASPSRAQTVTTQ